MLGGIVASDIHIVDLYDVPTGVVLAVLYAVAQPSDISAVVRPPRPVSIPEIQSELVARRGVMTISAVNGRVIDIAFTGDRLVDVTRYDAHNGSGTPLAAALVERVRVLLPTERSRLLDALDGPRWATRIGAQVLAEMSPADYWRISDRDHFAELSPDERFIKQCNMLPEFLLVRRAWVNADRVSRSKFQRFYDAPTERFDYLGAFDHGAALVSPQGNSARCMYLRAVLRHVRGDVARQLAATDGSHEARRQAWLSIPGRVGELLPMMGLAARSHHDPAWGDDPGHGLDLR